MKVQNDLILQALRELSIEFTHYYHEPVYTCEAAVEVYAREGIEGAQAKNLFLRNKKGDQHYLVVMAADKPFDIKAFSETVQDRKLGFASPERLWQYLQTKPGSVSPLNLVFDTEDHVRVVLDADFMTSDGMHFHPGTNEQTVYLQRKCLERWLDEHGGEWTILEL